MIEPDLPDLPVTVESQLQSLSRARVYYRLAGPSVFEVAVNYKIDEVYTAWPFYG